MIQQHWAKRIGKRLDSERHEYDLFTTIGWEYSDGTGAFDKVLRSVMASP